MYVYLHTFCIICTCLCAYMQAFSDLVIQSSSIRHTYVLDKLGTSVVCM